jgi:stage II sporulation protein D
LRRDGRGLGAAVAAIGAILVASLLFLPSCGPDEPVLERLEPALGVRPVRVLLSDAEQGCRVRVLGGYHVCGPSGEILDEGDEPEWVEVGLDADGRVRWRHPDGIADLTLSLQPVQEAAIEVELLEGAGDKRINKYAGDLEFSVIDGRLRILNLLDVENYVAGVVPNEVWPNFHQEAFKAQAIAARTYALYMMAERGDRPYDVRAGEGDQVYRGLREDEVGGRVRSAVNATHGLVLAWESPHGLRIFCTFYSAACGGMTQGIAELQPNAESPPTLRGGVACDFCSIARGEAYRWKTTEIEKTRLLARLQSRDAAFSAWSGLAAVEVARRTETGRIGEVRLSGKHGERASMRGERFRLAVGSRIMRSTACDLTDAGEVIRFENGRGFGHGVGLCQWGMEGQAREGRRAGEILRYYYPGAHLVRAY